MLKLAVLKGRTRKQAQLCFFFCRSVSFFFCAWSRLDHFFQSGPVSHLIETPALSVSQYFRVYPWNTHTHTHIAVLLADFLLFFLDAMRHLLERPSGIQALTCLTLCSPESRYAAAREHIHVVGASSTVQTWVTSALIDIWFEMKAKITR